MAARSHDLQTFLDRLAEGFGAGRCEPEAAAAITKLFVALEQPGSASVPAPSRLPVCRHVVEAIAMTQSSSTEVSRLASAFAALDPALAWKVRQSSGPFASANWPDGHANAMIVGPQGSIESRSDVAIGASLLAPNVRYPDHQHAPEEVYLLLTPGRFRHGGLDWCEPGAGGTFHNVPNIEHAMASDGAPLLAFWCLILI